MKKNKNKSSLIITALAAFTLTFAIAFIVGIGIVAVTDNEAWQGIKSTYLSDNDTTKLASQDLGNVLTGTVEITLPKEFIDLGGEEFDYTLTQEQKDNGFTDIKKNDDGSATYTMKKSDYKKYIAELKQTTKDSFDKMLADGTYTTIEKIEYTDDFEKITIIANKEDFENSLDSFCILSCGLTSYMYQVFDVDASGKCTVEVKDSATGEVFQTTVYPDALQED